MIKQDIASNLKMHEKHQMVDGCLLTTLQVVQKEKLELYSSRMLFESVGCVELSKLLVQQGT